MVSERSVRLFHPPVFALITVAGIVALAISASLVKYYNDHEYPNKSYRDRIRILLVASIWSVGFGIYLLVGVLVASSNVIFGIAAHLFGLIVGFLLFIIGAASLTALTDKTSCNNVLEGFPRCNIVKGLVAISWIETIFLLIALLVVFSIGVKARSGAGMRRGTLLDA